jgi:ferredoxin
VQLEQPCVIAYERRPRPESVGYDRQSATQTGPVGEVTDTRVEVDLDLCQAHSVCCTEAPDVFELGPDRKVRVLVAEPNADRLDAVRQAVRHCPTGALSVVESDDSTPDQED